MGCAILDFAPCKEADKQIHIVGKMLGQKKSARQITISSTLSSRCQAMSGETSQTSGELVCKETSRRINAEGNFEADVKFVRQSAPAL